MNPHHGKDLWIQVCGVLKWHNKGNDQCIDILNRLLCKQPEVAGGSTFAPLALPKLTESMLGAPLEHWMLAELQALTRTHDRDDPLAFRPIVVLDGPIATYSLMGRPESTFGRTETTKVRMRSFFERG